MRTYFERLGKPWQDAIDDAIISVDGNEHPEVAEAYREREAKSLSECRIRRTPTKRQREEFESCYIAFHDGWTAHGIYVNKEKP